MKPARKSKECIWQVKIQETPLLHALGMSIAMSNRAMLVIYQIWRKWQMKLRTYSKKDMVRPSNLKTRVFTAEAVDKIDHNSSSTISISFHGTRDIYIALIQHYNEAASYQGGYLWEQATIPTPAHLGWLRISVERGR